MPRSIWNGTLTFGLIAVPVKVHSATDDTNIHAHQVHAKDGERIKQRRVCSKEGKEVPDKQVAKGYEVRKGEHVVLTQDEIDAAAGDRSHVIELAEFVCAPEIDPVFYDRTYHLGAFRPRVVPRRVPGPSTRADRGKARGEMPSPPAPEQSEDQPDLMAALEASLDGAGSTAKARSSSRSAAKSAPGQRRKPTARS